jgi:hypothetical protein
MSNFRLVGLDLIYDHSGSTFLLRSFTDHQEAKQFLDNLSCGRFYRTHVGE